MVYLQSRTFTFVALNHTLFVSNDHRPALPGARIACERDTKLERLRKEMRVMRNSLAV